MSAVMKESGELSSERLHQITGKKRPHCQHAWFQREFGVDLPRNSERVIISEQLWEKLQAKRAGLLVEDIPPPAPARPKIFSLKNA